MLYYVKLWGLQVEMTTFTQKKKNRDGDIHRLYKEAFTKKFGLNFDYMAKEYLKYH